MDYNPMADPRVKRAEVIADLEAEITRLQAAIAALKALERPPIVLTRSQVIDLAGRANMGGVTARATLTTGPTGPRGPEPQAATLTLQPAPRSLVEAAELVLREAKKPLGMRELIRGIQARGYRKDDNIHRLRNTLAPGLRMAEKSGKNIVNRGKGIYALREWSEVIR